jgi:ubiquinone/menaquinone biosynthesis C-methylase UbiE
MARRLHYGDVGRIYTLVDHWLATTRPPRKPSALVELIDLVAPPRGSVAADLGSYDGKWAEPITARFGCHVVPVDIEELPIKSAQSRGLAPVLADMQHLPFPSSSLSLVWCRDALSMVPDVGRVLRETARVLTPDGGAVIYTALTTPRLEPLERSEFFEALDAPEWWDGGRATVDAAIAETNLEVVHEERFSPENQESALAEADTDLLMDLVALARLERERPAFEAIAPGPWAGRVRAWNSWAIYLLLGKLETRAWVLRKSSLP